MEKRFSRALLGALACAVNAVQAQSQFPGPPMESSVTVYGGYRWGGSFTDTTTGQGVNVNDHSSYAVAADIGLDSRRQLELFYGHQRTALSSGAFSPAVNNLPLSIDYFHIGGTYFFQKPADGAYVVGGVGVTSARPGEGLHSEVKPSINLGFGYMLPLGRQLALRFEARGYATLFDSSGSLFCGNGNGCVVSIQGMTMSQGEALIGLSARF